MDPGETWNKDAVQVGVRLNLVVLDVFHITADALIAESGSNFGKKHHLRFPRLLYDAPLDSRETWKARSAYLGLQHTPRASTAVSSTPSNAPPKLLLAFWWLGKLIPRFSRRRLNRSGSNLEDLFYQGRSTFRLNGRVAENEKALEQSELLRGGFDAHPFEPGAASSQPIAAKLGGQRETMEGYDRA